ncbi:L-threonylcarbamoyladenylate synthase, partial [Scytonema sp. NUACC21]
GIYCTKQNVEELGELNLTARRLIDHFWPGPLSIIVNKKEIISDTFTNNNPTILLLSAKNRVLSEVVRRCSIPIFSTTCNFSGEKEITESSMLKPFENLVDFIGVVQNFHFHSRVTTTVNCIEQPPKIIRHGAINVQQIKDVIPEIQENLSLLIQ